MAWLTRTGDGNWSPATLLQNQFGRLLQDFFEDSGASADGADDVPRWLPSLDIDETEDEFVVTAEIPGVDPNDVEITVVGNTLTIHGEVRREEEKSGRRRHRRERRYGEFVRVLTLPTSLDTDAVRASCRDGVLELHLPKRAEAKPKHIRIEPEPETESRRELGTTPQSPGEHETSAAQRQSQLQMQPQTQSR